MSLGNDGSTSAVFMPLYLMSIWKEPTTLNADITISFVLPRGMKGGGFSVRVTKEGLRLEIIVKWSPCQKT